MELSPDNRSTFLKLALIAVVFVSTIQVAFQVLGDPEYIGVVVDDETGEPINDARVSVFYRRHRRWYRSQWYSTTGTRTDENGRFQLDMTDDRGYLFFVTVDNGEDRYVPYGVYHNPSGDPVEETIRLWKASTVFLEGRDFFVETAAVPEVSIRVLEPETLDPVEYGEMNLHYGSITGTVSSYMDIPSGEVYVPAGKEFVIKVTANVERRDEQLTEIIYVNDFSSSVLGAGEEVEVDLQEKILPASIDGINNKTSSLSELILEKESQGFFLAVERQKLGRAESLISSAIGLVEAGESKEAFTALREAYVILFDLEDAVTSMLSDAGNSVFILVAFIGVSSVVLSALAIENTLKRLLSGVILFAVLLSALVYLHPGAQVTPILSILRMSLVTLVSVNMVGVTVPFILRRGKRSVNASIQHMVLPILSIAKRSLRRRRLRFLLTLSSVLLLVASFISLTSFTSGFGLSVERISDSEGKTGVMIRTPDPPITRDAAPFSGGIGVSGPLPLDKGLIGWLTEEDTVESATPRYESDPKRQYREGYSPVGYVDGYHLFGVLSVHPGYEAAENALDKAVVEGMYIGEEEGEAMISAEMASEVGIEIGDDFALITGDGEFELTLVGILDDLVTEDLTDIDGDSILPRKIVEYARIEYDGPDYVVEEIAPCEASEVVIVNLATSVNMTSMKLTRINLELTENSDEVEYARTTALNRGFRAWAASESGIYLAQLSEYFGGKGLPIVIPWIIVVLNVVVTMMNAYYERRQEVMIFSSIGMNPRHISSIFLAEAAVTGIIGGSLGYLLGLGAYKFIFLVTPALQVKQKVSAMWSVGAIGISLAAVLIGGAIALRNSVSITPSLIRRWRLSKPLDGKLETMIHLPVHVFEEELSEYMEFLEDRLNKAKKGREMKVGMIRKNQKEDSLGFSYIYSTATGGIAGLYSKNRLEIKKAVDGTYSTVLFTEGDDDSVKKAGGFMRRVCLEWSIQREEI